MKKTLFFALILLMTLPSMAQTATVRNHHGGHPQNQASTLTIISSNRQGFWLFVDDILQNEDPVRSIRVTDFWADQYHIRVEIDNKLHNCVGQYVDMSRSQTLSIAQYEGLFGLDFTQAHVRPELTMSLLTATMPPAPPAPQVEVVQPPMPPVPMEPGMNPKDYDEAYALLSKETFDETRLTLAKQIVSRNPMTVNQIAQICRLFTFEDNRLEFAKFAYHFCVEKNKYYMLNDVFTYDSSKRELNEFINGH